MYRDERVIKLAKSLVNYSVKLKKGERLLIITGIQASPLVKEIIKEAYKIGAYPTVEIQNEEIDALSLEMKSLDQINLEGDETLEKWKKYQACIRISPKENQYNMKNIPGDKMKALTIAGRKRLDYMIKNIKWCILNYPTYSLAEKAKMPTDQFADYLFEVSTIDYEKMALKMEPLVKLMNKTDKVKILSPGTDLTFSIKDIPTVKCAGQFNIPDGEIFTSPVRESVNGYITYNTPCPYQGNVYNNVRLEFENGKIVKATADNDQDKLNQIFETDEGAKYIGEFAIGVNHKIHEPIGDILLDEKIHGSIHFTPGQAYEDAYNGNDSGVHWDMILIQRKEFGGGEIYFDDVLIRKDGLFVLPELVGLNPDNMDKI